MEFLHGHDEERGTSVCLTTVIYISACLFLLGSGRKAMWRTDEFPVAGPAMAMVCSGDWVSPRLNEELLLERPPLHYGVVAAIFRCGGVNAFWARLPAAIAAVSSAVVLFLLVRRQGFSNLQALASGLILTTFYGYFRSGHLCGPDMVSSLFSTTTMLGLWQASHAASRKNMWYLVFVSSLCGMFLVDGLIGAGIVVMPLVCWMLFRKPLRLQTYALLLPGCALAAIPTAMWMWLVSSRMDGSLACGVAWQGVQLAGFHPHFSPLYHHLRSSLIGFLPWFLLLPWAMACHVRRVRDSPSNGPILFALIWLITSFVGRVVTRGIGESCFVPVYLPAAILIGTCLMDAMEKQYDRGDWFPVLSQLLAVVILVTPIGLAAAGWPLGTPGLRAIAMAPALCLGVWAYERVRAAQWMHFYGIAIASLMLLFLGHDRLLTRRPNAQDSYHALYHCLRSLDREGTKIVLFKPSPAIRGATFYYLHKSIPVVDQECVLRELLMSGENAAILAKKADAHGIGSSRERESFRIDDETLVILGNDDGLGPPIDHDSLWTPKLGVLWTSEHSMTTQTSGYREPPSI